MTTTEAKNAAPIADADAVAPAIERLVNDAGHHLYDVTVGGGSVRVLVAASADRATGVGVDDLARLSRDIGRLLDELAVGAGRYTLEVSSPGLERPLRRLEHFRLALGEQVRIKAVDRAASASVIVEGQLLAADETTVTVLDGDGKEREIAHANVRKARTVFDPKGATK